MQLSSLQIHSRPQTDCVYTACDVRYFRDFGPAFANSVLTNSDFGVHFHIFNAEPCDIEFCQSIPRVSFSHEHVPLDVFATATRLWESLPLDDTKQTNLARTQQAMWKGGDANLQERMQRTYFACVRFVRLRDLYDARHRMFAMDVDAVVRARLRSPGDDRAFYIHRIHGAKARYLAGGIWLNAVQSNCGFLDEYAAAITSHFHDDYIYWGIDQDVLEHIVPKWNHAELPQEYIDWNMQAHSMVWTAKGNRKNNLAFLEAKRQFSV